MAEMEDDWYYNMDTKEYKQPLNRVGGGPCDNGGGLKR